MYRTDIYFFRKTEVTFLDFLLARSDIFPTVFLLTHSILDENVTKEIKENTVPLRKFFVKYFPISNLNRIFLPHFLNKIRRLENWAHLFVLNYKCAKFQGNPSRSPLRSPSHSPIRSPSRTNLINSASVQCSTYLDD